MSRYPNEDVARFDQQFAETEDERNERLAAARKRRAQQLSDPIRDALYEATRSDGVPARTAVVMGSIENMRSRLLSCQLRGMSPSEVGLIALEEVVKVFAAKTAYDRAFEAEVQAVIGGDR